MKLGQRLKQAGRILLGADTKPPTDAARPRSVLVGGNSFSSMRTVTDATRKDMYTYGILESIFDQIREPILGADCTLEISGPEGDKADEIATDLQDTLDGLSRPVRAGSLESLWFGWQPGEVLWEPTTWIPRVRFPDPTTCAPLFDEYQEVIGFEQQYKGPQTGYQVDRDGRVVSVNKDKSVTVINEGWLAAIFAVYGSIHGEVPGRALADRVAWDYEMHRTIRRWLRIHGGKMAVPPLKVGYPYVTATNPDGTEYDRWQSTAQEVGTKAYQSDDPQVITTPNYGREADGGEKGVWEFSYPRPEGGLADLKSLNILWFELMSVILGVPPEMVLPPEVGTQSRVKEIVKFFLQRLDGIADSVCEPPLTALMQAVALYRYGPGVEVKVNIESLDTSSKDLLADLLKTAIQSKAGLSGMSDQGIDVEAICADIGVPYDPERIKEPEPAPVIIPPTLPDEGDDDEGVQLGHRHDKLTLAAAGSDGQKLETFVKGLLPRLVNLVAGPKGIKGGLFAELEPLYRKAVETGETIAFDPDLKKLYDWGNSIRLRARELAVDFFRKRGLEKDAEGIVKRADVWCERQVEREVDRFVQRLTGRATDAGRAANGRPAVPQAADRYWTDQVLTPAQGDALRMATQLGFALLGKYREALSAYR